MSVSDYIKYKRIGTQLRDVLPNAKKQAPPVFEDQMYIDFKQYTIENTITDTKLIQNSLIPTGSNLIFNTLKNVSNCPSFPLCKNTDKRTNRAPTSGIFSDPTKPYFYNQTIEAPKYLKQVQPNGQVFHNQRIFDQKSHLNKPACGNCVLVNIKTKPLGGCIQTPSSGLGAGKKTTCQCIVNKKYSNSNYLNPRIQYLKYANL